MGFLSPASCQLYLKAPNCSSLDLYDWIPAMFVIWAQPPIDVCPLHPHLAKEISQYKKLSRHQPFWPLRQTYEQCLSQTLTYTSTATLHCCLGRSVESCSLSSVQKDTIDINRTLLTQNWFYSFLFVVCKSRVREQKDMGRSLWALGLSGRSVIKEGGAEVFVLLFIFWHIHMPPNFRHLAESNCPKFPLHAMNRDKLLLRAHLRSE